MKDCIFCRIVSHGTSAKVVYEDELALAFEDLNPQAPVHVLVVPKRHIESVDHADSGDSALLGHLVRTCATVARKKGIVDSGYRVVTNTGPSAGQSVFHLHFHVLGGRRMTWPPG